MAERTPGRLRRTGMRARWCPGAGSEGSEGSRSGSMGSRSSAPGAPPTAASSPFRSTDAAPRVEVLRLGQLAVGGGAVPVRIPALDHRREGGHDQDEQGEGDDVDTGAVLTDGLDEEQ